MYTHSLVLTFWLLCSGVVIHVLDWYPPPLPSDVDPSYETMWKVLGYTRPLRGFILAAFPIVLGISKAHRTQFDERTEKRMKAPDMVDPLAVASANGGKTGAGTWVAKSSEGEKKAVGLLVLSTSGPFDDAAASSAEQPTAEASSTSVKTRSSTKKAKQQDSPASTVDNLYLTTLYTHTKGPKGDEVLNALLLNLRRHLRAHAPASLQTVRALLTPELSPDVAGALERAGFQQVRLLVEQKVETMEHLGLFRWPQGWFELKREEWLKA